MATAVSADSPASRVSPAGLIREIKVASVRARPRVRVRLQMQTRRVVEVAAVEAVVVVMAID